jgi:hypothetical protein
MFSITVQPLTNRLNVQKGKGLAAYRPLHAIK